MKIYFHPQFLRSYQRLPKTIQKKAEAKEATFRHNYLDRRLNTHKLHGRLKNQWSFSVDRKYRVLFEFSGSGNSCAIFLDIGNHALYQ